MTVVLNRVGRIVTKRAKLTAASQATVYTAPASLAIVFKIKIVNTTGNTPTVVVEWVRASDSDEIYIEKSTQLTANGQLTIDDEYALQSGDTIVVTPNSTDALHVTVTAEEGSGK